jgi:hypothetical protein
MVVEEWRTNPSCWLLRGRRPDRGYGLDRPSMAAGCVCVSAKHLATRWPTFIVRSVLPTVYYMSCHKSYRSQGGDLVRWIARASLRERPVGGVVASFFCYLDGEEQTAGVLRVDGASAISSHRSCSRGQARGQWAGVTYQACKKIFSGRTLSVSMSTAAIYAGVVTPLIVPLLLPSPC